MDVGDNGGALPARGRMVWVVPTPRISETRVVVTQPHTGGIGVYGEYEGKLFSKERPLSRDIQYSYSCC